MRLSQTSGGSRNEWAEAVAVSGGVAEWCVCVCVSLKHRGGWVICLSILVHPQEVGVRSMLLASDC